MKFLVDAQLPRRLVSRLRDAGHEALHTLDLPLGNRTPDATINELSTREGLRHHYQRRRFRKLVPPASEAFQAVADFNRERQEFGVGGAARIKSGKYRGRF